MNLKKIEGQIPSIFHYEVSSRNLHSGGERMNWRHPNMGYIGRRMSVNADKAYKKGLLPRSRFTKQLLRENGWTYSVSFFNWLCKQAYIMPQEYHHSFLFYRNNWLYY